MSQHIITSFDQFVNEQKELHTETSFICNIMIQTALHNLTYLNILVDDFVESGLNGESLTNEKLLEKFIGAGYIEGGVSSLTDKGFKQLHKDYRVAIVPSALEIIEKVGISINPRSKSSQNQTFTFLVTVDTTNENSMDFMRNIIGRPPVDNLSMILGFDSFSWHKMSELGQKFLKGFQFSCNNIPTTIVKEFDF